MPSPDCLPNAEALAEAIALRLFGLILTGATLLLLARLCLSAIFAYRVRRKARHFRYWDSNGR